MLDLRLANRLPRASAVVAMAVAAAPTDPAAEADSAVGADSAAPAAGPAAADGPAEAVPRGPTLLSEPPRGVDPAEIVAFLDEVAHTGKAGSTRWWVRPLQPVSRLLLVGVGDRDEAAWRTAGAALARKAKVSESLTVLLPPDVTPAEVCVMAEGMWLAAYRFRLRSEDDPPKLRRVTLVVGPPDTDPPGDIAQALDTARAVARWTAFARDLTNTPSDRKSPAWLARQVAKEARGIAGLDVRVREPAQLAAEGFGGVLAVGGGSAHGPHLVELSWRPRGAKRHVVLIGKGITFDTGGVCIKNREGMKLMRKDMAGAAAVVSAAFGAAALRLPVRVTALLPLAENMLSGTAMRPGDVVRHYDGTTTEVRNTDAEGRLVLADALAYAARRLRPDVLIDLATLTGAQSVALGKRTAALYSENDALADALTEAGADAGEKMWRMPLHDDYRDALDGDDTDLVNSTTIGGGSVMAALFLREFTGECRGRWAHLDMSAPAWADSADAELVKGATGWGVRLLLRWLTALPQ